MSIIIFDTETTGLIPGYICQLSYLIVENSDIHAKNFYFKVNYIENEAQLIHGYSVELLQKLSDNKRFFDYCNEIKGDFEQANLLIAHNFEFDMKFMITEFIRCRQKLRFNRGFCTMKSFKSQFRDEQKNGKNKYPKLEELIHFFGVSEEDINDNISKIYKVRDLGFHDARFDVVSTYLSYLRAFKMGYLNAKL